MSMNKLAAGNQARLGPTTGNMMGMPSHMGLSPHILQLLHMLMSGQAGRPNWGPGSGDAGILPSPNFSNPWGTMGSGQSGMSGQQGNIGGNFTGLPFFPNLGGGKSGFGTGLLTPPTGPYGSMGNTRPYAAAPTGNLFLDYPGFSMQGQITGSGGGVHGNR